MFTIFLSNSGLGSKKAKSYSVVRIEINNMKKKLQILKGLGLFKISLSTNPIIEMNE